MNRQEITEAMEGFRTDLEVAQQEDAARLADALQQDVRLRERYERIRRWDQLVGDALDACPVPEGLCARLLDVLEESGSEPAPAGDSIADSLAAATQPGVAELPSVQLAEHRWSAAAGRKWLRRSVLLAASVSAAVLIVVSFWGNPFASQAPQLTADFADEVLDWTHAVSRGDWNTDFGAPELRDNPFDPRVQGIPHRWTCIQTRYAAKTVVYDLTVRRSEPTYLFCFPSARSSLPVSPPDSPFSTTGGFAIGAWQQGDLVFVLAVRGGERRYRGMIQVPVILGMLERIYAGRAIGQA
jgi:hypothetical protein